jgi:hypothetical protein
MNEQPNSPNPPLDRGRDAALESNIQPERIDLVGSDGYGQDHQGNGHKLAGDSIIDSMFNRVARTRNELYPRPQTERWLTWLARKMSQREQKVFLTKEEL